MSACAATGVACQISSDNTGCPSGPSGTSMLNITRDPLRVVCCAHQPTPRERLRLERRLEVRPNDINTLLELGKAYFSQERSDDSLRTFRRAADLAPNCAEAHTHLAMELHLRGAHEEAAAAYRRALDINPREFNAVVYYADLLCGRPLGTGLLELTPVQVYARAVPVVNQALRAS